MNYTLLPSIKGQITIPPAIRKKYGMNKNTPLIVEDKGKGVITIKVMKMVDHDTIEYLEDKKGANLHFKNGISPQAILKKIKEIDG